MIIEKIFTVTAVTSQGRHISTVCKFIEDCLEHIDKYSKGNSNISEWVIESHVIGSPGSSKVQQVIYMQEHIILQD